MWFNSVKASQQRRLMDIRRNEYSKIQQELIYRIENIPDDAPFKERANDLQQTISKITIALNRGGIADFPYNEMKSLSEYEKFFADHLRLESFSSDFISSLCKFHQVKNLWLFKKLKIRRLKRCVKEYVEDDKVIAFL